MDYKVVLAPRAIEDLRDIVLYIAPDRTEAAKRLGLALIDKTKVLLNGRSPNQFGRAPCQPLRHCFIRRERISAWLGSAARLVFSCGSATES